MSERDWIAGREVRSWKSKCVGDNKASLRARRESVWDSGEVSSEVSVASKVVRVRRR